MKAPRGARVHASSDSGADRPIEPDVEGKARLGALLLAVGSEGPEVARQWEDDPLQRRIGAVSPAGPRRSPAP